MTVVLRLAALLVRRGGARGGAALALTVVGVATSTALALLAASVAPAFDARADRIAWRQPSAVDIADATAIQRRTFDTFEGQPITVVELEAVAGVSSLAPPGVRAFPSAGTVLLSPALADLVDTHPADELGDRFPGARGPDLGAIGLAHADELVAVVMRPAGTLDPITVDRTASVHPDAPDPTLAPGVAVPVDDFARSGTDEELALYRFLAQIAAVLLVIPMLLLVGAAARLTAAHREQRLGVLRLAGATPGAVAGLTALETLLAAATGTLIGIVGYLAALPLAATVPLAGGRFDAYDLILGPGPLLLASLVIPVAAVLSAVVAIRRVVVSPLGVTGGAPPRRPRALRLVFLPLAWLALVAVAGGDNETAIPLLVALGGVVATVAVVGPWLTWVLGTLLSRLARRPAVLLAGRRIVDDPRGAYRTVSGMVLAGLVAGFVFGVLPSVRANELPELDRRSIAVDRASGDEAALRAAVLGVDPAAMVDLGPVAGEPGGAGALTGIVVASSLDSVERVRTALGRAAPGAVLDQYAGLVDGLGTLDTDVGRGALALALAALGMAVTAAAISGISAILDQRTTLARLRLVGTPLRVLQRARRWQTVVPLVLATAGALATGALAGASLMVALEVDASRVRPPAIAPMALVVVTAVIAGLVVVAATRPVLVAVSRATPRER